MIFKIVPLEASSKLDGNGFTGSDGWLPGDYGALESVYTLGSNWSPDGEFLSAHMMQSKFFLTASDHICRHPLRSPYSGVRWRQWLWN
jgi:hypothetical protein